MARCPNCGRETARTTDWACQWCGYPLLSGSYKKIPKTYRELKEERQPQPLVVEEAEPEPVPVAESELEPVSEAETETILETEPVVSETVAEPILEPELTVKPKPKARRKPAAKRKSAPRTTTKTKPAARRKRATRAESTPEIKPEPLAEAEPESPPEAEPEPAPAVIELTVDELFSAYETDGTAADARFANQILKVTGVVDRIEVKEALDIYYITLTGAEKTLLLQSVRCMFGKKDAPQLSQLIKGQTLTVRGRYDGSMINTRLVDCVLIP